MKVTTESSNPTEIILNIALDAADEEPFIDRSYRRTVGNLAIPGFRKGKAPRSVVESHVGRQALLREALDYMIPETLNRVMQERELRAFIEPQVEMLEWEPVAFKAVIPLEPAVDLGDFRQLRLEKEPREITEAQVDLVIERLRRESAPWEPVARPAQFGDLLTLNVRGEMDGAEIINDSAVDFIPQPGNVLPFPGFAQHLEGLLEGVPKDFVVVIPEDYPRPEFAGKEIFFAATALAIKEKNLPEADDEFAKGVEEGFESIEALRAEMAARLGAEASAQADYAFQERTLATVLDQSTVDLSDLVIGREVQGIVEERERMLRNQRLDLETYLTYVGKTPEEFQEELRPEAIDRLRRTLVMRQLAKEESIAVTAEEVQAEVAEMLENTAEENLEAMRRALYSDETLVSIQNAILTRKTMARLVAIVQGLADAETESDTDTESAAAVDSDQESATESAGPETATATAAAAELESATADPETASPAADIGTESDSETASPAAAGESDPETETAAASAAAIVPETQGNDEGAKPDVD